MASIDLLAFQNLLLRKLAEGGTLEHVVETIGAFIEKPVFVINLSSRILAHSLLEHANNEDKFLQITSQDSASKKMVFIWHDQAYDGLRFPIEINNQKLGYIILASIDDAEDNWTEIGYQAALLCAVEIVKQKELITFERRYKEAFIYDLLYGNAESAQDIIARGLIWGWNLALPHGVIVFELEEYEQYSPDSHLAEILFDIVSAELEKSGRKPIVLRKKGEIIVVLTVEASAATEQKNRIEILVKKVMNEAREKFAPRVIRVGVGRIYRKPDEIFRSYQEAKVALELGKRLNMRHQTPYFKDLGLVRILYNHDSQELRDFYTETLGEIERFDKEQNSDLMNSLEKYLMYHCDLKTAADVLFLHPNTLRYRLKKVEELLNVDLNHVDVKLNLMAAFKINYLKQN